MSATCHTRVGALRQERQPTVLIGNEIRTALHRFEYLACLAYFELFKRYGLNFLKTHDPRLYHHHLHNPRRPWSLFGLTEVERAEAHYMRGIQKYVLFFRAANIEPNVNGIRYSSNSELSQIGDAATAWASQQYEATIHEMKMACSIDLERDDFRTFLQGVAEIGKLCHAHHPEGPYARASGSALTGIPNDYVITIPPPLANEIGVTQWVGDYAMLEKWGGMDILRHLAGAQERMSEGEIQQLLSNRIDMLRRV